MSMQDSHLAVCYPLQNCTANCFKSPWNPQALYQGWTHHSSHKSHTNICYVQRKTDTYGKSGAFLPLKKLLKGVKLRQKMPFLTVLPGRGNQKRKKYKAPFHFSSHKAPTPITSHNKICQTLLCIHPNLFWLLLQCETPYTTLKEAVKF